MITPELLNTVFSKNQYDRVIETSFTELGQQAENATPVETTITVDQFFQYYNDLFFDIPKFGDLNSHEYLIKTSTEYVQADFIDSTIQALLDEITELRDENIQLTQQLAQDQTA